MRYRYNAESRGPQHVHQRVLNDYIDQLLSKGAKAVADALKDLARDSEVRFLLLFNFLYISAFYNWFICRCLFHVRVHARLPSQVIPYNGCNLISTRCSAHRCSAAPKDDGCRAEE